MVIDGDVFGPRHFPALLAAVRRRGRLAAGVVCTASRPRLALPDGLSLVVVPRGKGGKDPNDIAVAFEAARLAFQDKVNAIALAAPVEWFQSDDAVERRPTKKIVLQPDGWSRIEDLHPAQFGKAGQVEPLLLNTLRTKLCELNYLEAHDHPLLPAVAKLFAAQGKALTAWPKLLAFQEALEELSTNGSSWSPCPHAGVFVMPLGTQVSSKAWLEACGSLKGVEMVRGGGARLFADSPELVLEVLQQLGYYGDELNEDLSEAIDTFAEMKGNSKALAAISISIKPDYPVHTKRALLHAALVSPKLHGEWQLAPSDDLVRGHLLAHGWLRQRAASRLDVFTALCSFSEAHGLPLRRTYNGAVREFSNHLTKVDPSLGLLGGGLALGLRVPEENSECDEFLEYEAGEAAHGAPAVVLADSRSSIATLRIFGGPEPPPRDLNWVPRVCTPLYEGPGCSNVTHWNGTVRLEIDNHIIPDVHMHSRGHSSAMFPKHQFSLKLPTQMPLLGMSPAKRWVLATSFVDVSFQRNPTAFEVYRKLGGWATDTVYVNVEWHGVDYGLYYIGERIECGGGRLDSCHTEPGKPQASDFLLTIDWAKAGKVALRSNVTSTFFSVLSPKKKGLPSSSKAFLQELVNSVDSLAASGAAGLEDLLDFGSFVRYFLVEELAKDVDGYAFSKLGKGCCVWLCRNYVMVRQGRLLHAAPWDFDLAFDFACMPRYFTNVFTQNVSLGVTGWNVENSRADALWIGPSGIPGGSVQHFGINKRQLFLNLWLYPGFKAAFAHAWKAARGRMLGDANLIEMVRRRSSQISAAAKNDLHIWRRTNRCGFWRCCEPEDTHSFDRASEHLSQYLVSRARWIDANVDALLKPHAKPE
ncbi:unnamed protein product [Symbiodinium natans]|uniref:Uncharacterized protein n=1 Tax=Symbiodinium natans TaxID=878477 RepID=A0A812HUM9_9DINO|nr:unnamed protein product [Symbiodinium natans]